MREVKLHVFDDYEEDHSEIFKGKLFENIITLKRGLSRTKKSKIDTLLKNPNSIKYKDKEAANTLSRKRQQKLIESNDYSCFLLWSCKT